MKSLTGKLLLLVSVIFLITAIESCHEDTPSPILQPDITDSTDVDTTVLSTDTIPPDTLVSAPDTTNFIYGTFSVMSHLSGKLLDIEGSSTENKTQIYQWTANGSQSQMWKISPTSNHHKIINAKSGLALGTVNRDTVDGTAVYQSTYLELESQQWDFKKVNDSSFLIVNVKSGRALTLNQGKTIDGAPVSISAITSEPNQIWSLGDGSGGSAKGQLKWEWVSQKIPEDAKKNISEAMDAAVLRYNRASNWPDRTLTVEYNEGVATADANINGHIRFGPVESYQRERTALHEIAHTYGVGTSWKWNSQIGSGGAFTGENTIKLIQYYDGLDAKIWTGGNHFWPYGLNYDNEWSEENAHRHVEIVAAMVLDGFF